jgi:molybdate transport system substrate-binding protein
VKQISDQPTESAAPGSAGCARVWYGANLRLGPILFSFVALMAPTFASSAQADEIRMLASNALRAPYVEVLPVFEKATGHRVFVDWGGTVDIMKRAGAGEAADIVIVPSGRVDELINRALAISRVDLARSGIGIAAPAGAARPAVSTAEELKQALVVAKSVVLSSGPSAGAMFALFGKLGIADEMQKKTLQLAPGLSVGEAIAQGNGEIGFTQISELLSIKGIDYLGPLPAETQSITIFSAGLLSAATSPEAAKALMEFLSGPSAAPALRKHGMEPASRD